VANTILTPTMLARRALDILRNENSFIKAVPRQYQDEFGRANLRGQKQGSTISIRYPNDYVPRTGPVAVPQATTETLQTLVVAKQAGVDLSFTTVDLTMNIVDFSERYLEPAVNVIAGIIAADVISGSNRIPNAVHNVDGSNNTIAPTFGTFARAGALLDNLSVPRDQRLVFLDPITMGNSVTSFSGLFNNQASVGEQYKTGMIKDNVIGMNWAMDQTVPKQITAAYTAVTVGAANQSGTTLAITATTAPINAGDKFTIVGVYGVNLVNKTSNGQLRQFTVDAVPGTVFPAGTTSIPIFPAITPPTTTLNAQGNYMVPHQTVTASPAAGAALVFLFNAGETYRQNIIMNPKAVQLAIVPLDVPSGPGVIRSATESQDGVSISLVTFYDGINFQEITRLDVLYGYLWTRPGWACIVGDAL